MKKEFSYVYDYAFSRAYRMFRKQLFSYGIRYTESEVDEKFALNFNGVWTSRMNFTFNSEEDVTLFFLTF